MIDHEKSFRLTYSNTHLRTHETLPLIKFEDISKNSRYTMYPHPRQGDVGNEPGPERFYLLSISEKMADVDGLNNLE